MATRKASPKKVETARTVRPVGGRSVTKGGTKKAHRGGGPQRAKVSSSPSTVLVLRYTMVRPEKTRRSEVSQKLEQGKGKRPAWYGITTKKDKATIITRYKYVKLPKKPQSTEELKALLTAHHETAVKAFKKTKANSLSVTAQYIRGRVVDRHRARMAGNGFVGTQIYGESIAKKTRKKTKDGKGRVVTHNARTMKTKAANQLTQFTEMVDKMQEYGLVSVSSAREKLTMQRAKRLLKKRILITNREEKDEQD